MYDNNSSVSIILIYRGYKVYKSNKTNFIAIYDKDNILRKYMPMRTTLTLDTIKFIIDRYLNSKEILQREAEQVSGY